MASLASFARQLAVQTLEEERECCLQCGYEEFVTVADGCGEACGRCACMRATVCVEELVSGHSGSVNPKFIGGGLTKSEHDREFHETAIRSRISESAVVLSDEIIKTAAGFLADRSKYPRRKRTQKLYAKAIIDAGDAEGAVLRREEVAQIFNVKAVSGGGQLRSSDSLTLITTWLAECATRAKKNAPALAAKLERGMRVERLSYIHFCQEVVGRCAERGVCSRHEIHTRAIGACALLLECIGGDAQLLADVLKKRRTNVVTIAEKIGVRWTEFQDIHDQYHVPYPENTPAAILANCAQQRNLPKALQLIDELSDDVPALKEVRELLV
jgi:hypothetical protein